MTPGAPRNMDDPDYLAERNWGAAISRWFERDPSAMAGLIRASDSLIPDFAREFLADLAEGKVQRPEGRPPEWPGWLERSIVAEVFAEWEHSSKADAIATVGERKLGSFREGQIRGIVDKLAKDGFTRERWRAWGRPDFKNR